MVQRGFCSKSAPRGGSLSLEKSYTVPIEESHVTEELSAHLTCQPLRLNGKCNHHCLWKLHKSWQGFLFGGKLSEDECVLQK